MRPQIREGEGETARTDHFLENLMPWGREKVGSCLRDSWCKRGLEFCALCVFSLEGTQSLLKA